MSLARLRSALASVATALVTAAVASAGLVYAQGGPNPGGAIQSAANKPSPTLSVKGSASRLYPGGTVLLPLKVRNRTRYPISLRKLKVKVRSANRGCPASLLQVKRFKPKAKLGARKTATLKVRVRLSPAAPDACQRAKFPLSYRVTGIRTPAKRR
jgi:hypothetical protein